MRWGVLADVHGNLAALEAAIALLEGEGVDGYVCAGDLVGYGPFPNECVERVAGLRGLVCVAGNHDLIALGRLADERCAPLARDTLRWTADVLGLDARAWLEALPLDARADGDIVVAHGGLGDPEQYVRTDAQCSEQLDRLDEDADVLVLGHTHQPHVFQDVATTEDAGGAPRRGRERWLFNPGSVGQSRRRDPRGTVLVLDHQRTRRTAHFLPVDYDVEATRSALRARGLPPGACHLAPPPLPRRLAGRAARSLLRR